MKSGRLFCILESWDVVKYMYVLFKRAVLNKVGYENNWSLKSLHEIIIVHHKHEWKILVICKTVVVSSEILKLQGLVNGHFYQE